MGCTAIQPKTARTRGLLFGEARIFEPPNRPSSTLSRMASSPQRALRILAGLAFAAFAVAALARQAMREREATGAGAALPDAGGEIVAGEGSVEHDRVEFSQLRGKVLLLDFWASWCGPCRQSVPVINRLASRYASRGLEVVGVNVETERSADFVREAHAAFGSTTPSIHDKDGSIARSLEVSGYPTFVIVGKDGRIVARHAGVPPETVLAGDIETALAQ